MNYAKELILLHAVLDFLLEMRLARECIVGMLKIAVAGQDDARKIIRNGVNAREYIDQTLRIEYFNSMAYIYSSTFGQANKLVKDLMEHYFECMTDGFAILHKGFVFTRDYRDYIIITTNYNDSRYVISPSGFSIDTGRVNYVSESEERKENMLAFERSGESLDSLQDDSDIIMGPALNLMEDVESKWKDVANGD